MINLDSRIWQAAILLLLAFIWGSSFILMEQGLKSFSYTQVAAYRMMMACLVLVPFLPRASRHLTRSNWFWFAAVGFFGNGIPAFLFTAAQTVIDSSLAGMLNSLVPIFTLMLGLTIFGIAVRTLQILGVLIGLGGALLIILSQGVEGAGEQWPYALLVVAASFCYAISVNIIKYKLQPYGAITVTSLAMAAVGPLTGTFLFAQTDFVHRFVDSDAWWNLGAITLLGVVGTAMAVLIFNKLIQRTTAVFASSVTYLIPGVAIFWGYIFDENIYWQHLVGIAVVLTGIYLINAPRKKVLR